VRPHGVGASFRCSAVVSSLAMFWFVFMLEFPFVSQKSFEENKSSAMINRSNDFSFSASLEPLSNILN
jgi:hypothetical protein